MGKDDKGIEPSKNSGKPNSGNSAPDPNDAKGSNAIMLQTALRLGLRDIDAVQDYENRLDAQVSDARAARARKLEERNARFEAEKLRQEALARERRRNTLSARSISNKPLLPSWKGEVIHASSAFLKDLTFAEMAKTPQGIQMSMACLLHHDEVKSNAALREKMQAWLTKRMASFVANCYAPIVPLLLRNHISVRRHAVSFETPNGAPTTRMTSYTIFGFQGDVVFEGKPTKSRPSCLGMCGSKTPNEITLFYAKEGQKEKLTFAVKICLSHWNGILPEWVDIYMPEKKRFASIHSTTQVHVDIENNYDMFDNKGRVIGVASPERSSNGSDLINVTMYDSEGSAITARIKRTDYEHGEYDLDIPMEMAPELKAILIGLMIFLLVEDLSGYEGRGENGR